MPHLCGWCASGKPTWCKGPFKAAHCSNCDKKPAEVDGVKLKTPRELSRERRLGRHVDVARLKIALAAQRRYVQSFPRPLPGEHGL